MGFRLWDPIGVADYEGCEDEYETYLLQAFGSLRRGEDPSKVTSYLVGIEIGHMGLSPSPFATERAGALVDELAAYAASLQNGPLRISASDAADDAITFPALGFGEEAPTCAVPGVEGLHQLWRLDQLATGSLSENERRRTWEIVDSAGACWAISGSPVVGRPSWLGRMLCFPTRETPRFLFEPRFKRLPNVTLGQAKTRIVTAMRGNPYLYVDIETEADKGPEAFSDPEALVEPLCEKVQAAQSFAAAFDAIYWYGGGDDDDDTEPTPEGLRRARRWKIGCISVPIGLLAAAVLIYLLLPPAGQSAVRYGLGQFAIWLAGTTAIFSVIGVFMWLHESLLEPKKR